MAKIFLDANVFIDLIEKRQEITLEQLDGNDLFISPLSVHILIYISKRKIPYNRLTSIIDSFFLMTFDENIAKHSLIGPTTDFEDNVQLHSSVEAECDIFFTHDQQLLNLGFFGKVKILNNLSNKF